MKLRAIVCIIIANLVLQSTVSANMPELITGLETLKKVLIKLTDVLNPNILIVVRAETQHISLDMHPDSTIAQVKEQIFNEKKIPVAKQRILGKGAELKDETTLRELLKKKIELTTELHLIIRLHTPAAGASGPEEEKPTTRPAEETGMQIFIRTLTGKTITLDVTPDTTIADIKNKIFAKDQAFPVERQRIISNGKTLKNDKKTLRECKIAGQSDLNVILKLPAETAPAPEEKMQIFVKTLKGMNLPLEVMPKTTILQVKEQVFSQRPELQITHQKIIVAGDERDNKMTLEACGVTNGSTLFLVIRVPKIATETPARPAGGAVTEGKEEEWVPALPAASGIQIRVKALAGNMITIDTSLDDTIAQVKEKIFAKEKIPVEKQRLFCAGKEFENDHRVREYQHTIQKENTVHLVLQPSAAATPAPEEEKSYQIFVKTPDGKTVTLDVLPNNTIAQVKKKIFDEEKIPVGKQRLSTTNGTKLEKDSQTLKDYNVGKNSTLYLFKKTSKRVAKKDDIQIFVQVLTGKTITLDISPNDTIAQVKQQICNRELIPVERQGLLFAGKQLQNDRTAKDYNLVNRSTMHLVLRLPEQATATPAPEEE